MKERQRERRGSGEREEEKRMGKRYPLKKWQLRGNGETEEREADDKQWPPVTQDPVQQDCWVALSALAQMNRSGRNGNVLI